MGSGQLRIHFTYIHIHLFLTEKERASGLSEGIQSEKLSNIRCGSGDKEFSGVTKEIKLDDVYGNKY